MLPAIRLTDIMNTKTTECLLLLAVAGLCSCIGQETSEDPKDTGLSSTVHFDFGQPIELTRAEYPDYLKQKAAELADSELARLSAIELMYRDKTYFYSFHIPDTTISGAAYAKVYRQFTKSRLVDITSTDSIFHPVQITIDFQYDILGSDPVLSKTKDPQKAITAHNHKTYAFSRSATERRVYLCDEKGQPMDPFPPPLPRPNYWDEGKENQIRRFSLEEAF